VRYVYIFMKNKEIHKCFSSMKKAKCYVCNVYGPLTVGYDSEDLFVAWSADKDSIIIHRYDLV